MTDYIKKSGLPNQAVIIKDEIQKITGKIPIRMSFENGKLLELSVNDKKLSASKKKELQTYIDTLKD